MGLMGNGEGNTLLILTDAESRLIREVLDMADTLEDDDGGNASSIKAFDAQRAYAAGVKRGTAKLQEEAKAAARARKGK
jgi:hypothetical protein